MESEGRIGLVGMEGVLNLVWLPFGELNFVFIRGLTDDLAMTFKAKNIGDQRNEITQNGFIKIGYNRSREFSF
ncbi:MAG: hypothetical protein EVA69_02425 [OM182 bacterium]|uniref:TonB-dependent receptor n=1 Tax=OM182 bacterium TaxID=2510334 RepID=A0A520S379_9GAMM|nr:MAG: hypothetical protein CBD23_010040 [Gammaproteobacteria bacterium TMED163]RZO76923.1 MAG: hypothetical protein EVA69_02425 [OM182 bacterium]